MAIEGMVVWYDGCRGGEMRVRMLMALVLVVLGLPVWGAGFETGRAAGEHLQAPTISQIRPASFRVGWATYASADATTHYQVRIDHALFGASLTGDHTTVSSLKPGRTYKVEVITYHQGAMIGISSPTTVLTGPAAPLTVYATDVTTSTFQLHWTPVPTATAYHVVDASGKVLATAGASDTSALLGGFSPGQSVTVRVVSENPSSLSDASKPLTVVLKPRPPDLTVATDQIASSGFLLTWTAVEGASSYTVLIGTSPYAVVASSVMSLRVVGLEPGSLVTVKIMAENAAGASEYSAEQTVQLRPGDPAKPWVTDLASTTFVLSWNPVKGAESYQIFNEAWHLANVSASVTSTLVKSDFNPGEIATITLVARNSTGDSGRSPPVIVQFPSPTASGSATIIPEMSLSPGPDALSPGAPMPDIWLEDAAGNRRSLGTLPRTPPLVIRFWKGPPSDRLERLMREVHSASARFDNPNSMQIIDLVTNAMPLASCRCWRLAPPEPPALGRIPAETGFCLVIGHDGTIWTAFPITSAARFQAKLEKGLVLQTQPDDMRRLKSRFEGLHRITR